MIMSTTTTATPATLSVGVDVSEYAQFMNDLGPAERERAELDVHGIVPSAEMITQYEITHQDKIQQCLADMRDVLTVTAATTMTLSSSSPSPPLPSMMIAGGTGGESSVVTDNNNYEEEEDIDHFMDTIDDIDHDIGNIDFINSNEYDYDNNEYDDRDVPDHFVLEEHPGLVKALLQNSTYVHNECIKFLRAHQYNTDTALEGMGRYFDMKYQYFCCGGSSGSGSGSNNNRDTSVLTRSIRMEDFTEDDIKYYKTGYYQLLPTRDAAGRAISIVFPHLIHQYKIPVDTSVRGYMYSGQTLSESDDIQRCGTAFIIYALAQDEVGFAGDLSFASTIESVLQNVPVRRIATHFLYHHTRPSLADCAPLWASCMSSFDRARYRVHKCRTLAESHATLASLGIPADTLPMKCLVDDIHDKPVFQVSTDFNDFFMSEMQRKEHMQVGYIHSAAACVTQQEENRHHHCHADVSQYQHQHQQQQQQKQQPKPNLIVEDSSSVEGEVQTKLSPMPSPHESPTNRSTDRNEANVETTNAIVASAGDIIPSSNDVLMGRGSCHFNHPGNVRYRAELAAKFEEYEFANRVQKQAIVDTIVDLTLNAKADRTVDDETCGITVHSRFLCKDPTDSKRWMVATQEAARNKVAHDMRNLRRSNNNS